MYSLSHLYHSHHVFPKNLKILFASKLLRSIGVQFVTFFMPLFLFRLGSQLHFFPVNEFQNGMIFIGLYYFLERFGVFLATLPISRVIVQLGVRNSMVLSQLLYVCSLFFYIWAENHPQYLLIVLCIEAVRLPLFWCSYYALFSANAVYKNMGQSVGTIEFFSRLLLASIPAITGLIIVEFGFSYVFMTALFFQGLSILTLFFLEEKESVSTPSLAELKVWLHEPGFRLLSVSMIGKYTADMMQFLWPFFVLLLIGTADKVGYLYFVVFFVSLLLTYFSGWFVDHSKSRRPFSLSGSILGGIWLLRGFVGGIWTIMTVDVFNTLADSVFTPFYESILLRRGKGKKTLDYFVYREIIVSFGGIFFWGFFMLYFVFFDSWRNSILLGFIGIVLSIQLRDRQPTPLKEDRS